MIKNFLKKYKLVLILLMPIYLGIFLISIIPSKYSITLPGGISKVSEEIIINDTKNNIYSVYVIDYDKATFLQTFFVKLTKKGTVYKPSSSTSLKKTILRGKLLNELSYTNSIITAYEEAKVVDSSILINYETLGFVVTYSNNLLKIGDIITKVNGLSLLDVSKEELVNYLKEREEATFTVIRDNKTTTIKLFKNDGYFKLDFELYRLIKETYPKYEKTYKASLAYGPSGGFIQTLSIYASLLKKDYQLKIAGTGTIDELGRVGKIGGIKEKLYTVNNLVDIFFVPEENYQEALAIYNELNNKSFKLYKVSEFKDALKILK